ncbi:probable F-box protein At1g65740 [Solanum stenotomum]|uniref:probable F-box protein At1g65740 n=1 Tax=Solanum stenotomum TaxID=172797 RepID=UPI0020D09E4A|nr:probable F-box protein At1g65740 [Solanum stenotomum]
MADWANLPNDLIAHIANHVKVIEDFIAFGAVCTSWRIAATKDNFDVLSHQVPFLMMADGHDDRYQEIYSLSKKKVSRIFLPEVRGSKVVSIKEGWLCTVANDTGEINLLHPFSRKKIHLPSLNALLNFHDCKTKHWGCIYVAVLSANPSVTSDYVLMVLHYGSDNCLAFWRPGDLNWTNIDVANNFTGRPSALVYHKGEFYSMRHSGIVQAHEVAGPNTSDQPIVKTRLVVEMAEYTFNPHVTQYYLVELSGALLLVAQFDKRNMDFPNGPLFYHTIKFKVHEVDITRGELKEEMKTLGNFSMFLGDNLASCIDSSKFSGVKRTERNYALYLLLVDIDVKHGAFVVFLSSATSFTLLIEKRLIKYEPNF